MHPSKFITLTSKTGDKVRINFGLVTSYISSHKDTTKIFDVTNLSEVVWEVTETAEEIDTLLVII